MNKHKKILIIGIICLTGLLIIPIGGGDLFTEEKENEIVNNSIEFLLPMKGRITALYGWGQHPLGHGKRFHTGIDIGAPNGTPIYTAASGIVKKAGWDGSQGYSILIEHMNGYSTFYSHCDKVLVKDGQNVNSGNMIAKCGETGTATGNHLHFEIRINGKPVNPYPYIIQGKVNAPNKSIRNGYITPEKDAYIIAEKDEKGKTINEIEFRLPIKGHISRFFGSGPNPVSNKIEFHSGIDIAASKGTPIYASMSGIVNKAGWQKGHGYRILIKHNHGYSTVYSHCNKILGREGQKVKAGDMIAGCGATGLATGDHLHFEIKKNGKHIDPYYFLSGMLLTKSALSGEPVFYYPKKLGSSE